MSTTPNTDALRAYFESVRLLAKHTGVESIIQKAESKDPAAIFNAFVMCAVWFGARTVGAVESMTTMLAQVEVLLATAPPEVAEKAREQAGRSAQVGKQIDESAKAKA